MNHQRNNLDTVLKYRTRLVEDAQRELSELKQHFSIEETRLLQMDRKRKEVINDMAEQQNTGIKQEQMSLSHLFVKLQGERIREQKKRVNTLSGECESLRLQLEHLLREKESVEKIRTKRKAIQNTLFKKNENIMMDEISARQERSIR